MRIAYLYIYFIERLLDQSSHLGGDRAERDHHGHGVLHDASVPGPGSQYLQLLLHCDIPVRGGSQDLRRGTLQILQRQVLSAHFLDLLENTFLIVEMEPAGCWYSGALCYWHWTGGG